MCCQGPFGMGRVVVTEAFVLETLRPARTNRRGGDVPGVTINRFCASGIERLAPIR
jgi:hypothetical protein